MKSTILAATCKMCGSMKLKSDLAVVAGKHSICNSCLSNISPPMTNIFHIQESDKPRKIYTR